MTLHFFEGQLSTYIKKLEQFYELSGITIASKSNQTIDVLTSYPRSWMDHYMDKGYDHIDPVHLAGFNTTTDHIFWGGSLHKEPLGDQQLKLFEEAKHHCIISGVSFPLKSSNQMQLISLAFPHAETITYNLSVALLDELKSHIQILPSVLHIQKIKHATFLQDDITAFASKHADLIQDFHMITHEINDLVIALSAYLSYLPSQFRLEGELILETLQTTLSEERYKSSKSKPTPKPLS